MKKTKLKKNEPLYPKLSDLTLADALRADVIKITFREVAPQERGELIAARDAMRDCPTAALHGEIQLPKPALTFDGIREHLELLLCRHTNPNAVEAAGEIVHVDVAEMADLILTVGAVCPPFRDALLELRLGDACILLQTLDWPEEFSRSEAAELLETAYRLKGTFTLQVKAAWAWRMQHVPFDNRLGEANLRGYSTVGRCLVDPKQRRADFQTVVDLYRTGKDVPATKLRFLDRWGLGHLRSADPKEIYAAFGQRKIFDLPEIINACEAQATKIDGVFERISGVSGAANDNPLIDHRGQRADTFLAPVSSVVMLAMACAEFSRKIDGVSSPDTERPPEWLLATDSKKSAHREAERKFLEVFMFYRGLFVQDCAKAAVQISPQEDRCADQVDFLAALPTFKQRPRDIIESMRRCIAAGVYNAQPGAPASVSAFGRQFGWKKAS